MSKAKRVILHPEEPPITLAGLYREMYGLGISLDESGEIVVESLGYSPCDEKTYKRGVKWLAHYSSLVKNRLRQEGWE